MRATTKMWTAALMAVLAWQVGGASAAFAADAAQKCESGKLKEAAKYVSCRLKADAKSVTTLVAPDYSKCDEKFTTKFPLVESKALGDCPTIGDVDDEQAALKADQVATAWRLSAEPRFIDNGDGTITDRKTNLMWEKKIKLDGTENLLDARDADNRYIWAGQCTIGGKRCQPNVDASGRCLDQRDGDTTATGCDLCDAGEGACDTFGRFTIWTFIDVVNDIEGLAGYNDWRVPTIRELEALRSDDLTKYDPAVDIGMHSASCGTTCANVVLPECSCTAWEFYWSATTLVEGWAFAWGVDFNAGDVYDVDKHGYYRVRAVRAGL